jgi:hypothetical protein
MPAGQTALSVVLRPLAELIADVPRSLSAPCGLVCADGRGGSGASSRLTCVTGVGRNRISRFDGRRTALIDAFTSEGALDNGRVLLIEPALWPWHESVAAISGLGERGAVLIGLSWLGAKWKTGRWE